MFDGLRDDTPDSGGFDDQQVAFFPEEKKTAPRPVRMKRSGQLLGMTPQQRFLLAVMLMVMVCTLGAACMLISGSFAF